VAAAIVSRTEDALSSNPLMGMQGRAFDTREFVFSDLHYIAVYQVTGRAEVLAIVHTA